MKIEINKDGTVTIYGEVFVKQQNANVPTESKRQALLKEAKERYPIGTKFISIPDNDKYISECEPYFYTYTEDWIAVCKQCGVVYYEGQWAEILPSFPTIEEIYGSVKSCYWACQNGNIGDMKYVSECTNVKSIVPTKEDAEYNLASIMLIKIMAKYIIELKESGKIIEMTEKEIIKKYFQITDNYLVEIRNEEHLTEGRANANLIAAAPKILEALQMLYATTRFIEGELGFRTSAFVKAKALLDELKNIN